MENISKILWIIPRCLTVFPALFEHAEVAGVAALTDVAGLDGGADGAAGFVGVGAVGEAAIGGAGEDFGEEVGDFLAFHVHGAEAADAGGVDDATAAVEGEHFGEGGGVLAGVVGVGDGSGLQVEPRLNAVDEGGLADAGKTGEDGGLALQRRAEGVHVLAGGGGDNVAFVADAAVNHRQPAHEGAVFLVIHVQFVEHQDGGDVVCLGGRQEAVDEDGGGDGVVHGDDEHRAIDVGGDDMGLLGEVGGAADDVVAARLDGNDDAAVGAGFHLHDIAHGNRVGGAHAFHAKAPADAALDGFPAGEADDVPAAGGFDDCAFFHLLIILCFLRANLVNYFRKSVIFVVRNRVFI